MVPILARFRQNYEQVTLPLGHLCLRVGLSADTLTYLSLVFSVVAGYLIARQLFVWGVVAIALVTLADVLDGATARAGGTANDYGTVLDHVSDRYAEFFLLAGVLFSGVVSPVWVLLSLFGMVMASYVRARAESTHKLLSCNVGFAGRQEKLGLLVIGLLLQPLFPGVPLLEWAVIIIGAMSHITAVQRLAFTRKILLGSREQHDLNERSKPV